MTETTPIRRDARSQRPGRAHNRCWLLAGLLAMSLVWPALGAPASSAIEPATLQQEAEGDDASSRMEERRRLLTERRAARREAAQEMRERRNDPEYLKQQAWWNDEENIEKLGLSAAQRRTADTALVAFVESRQKLAEASREAQAAFFEAVASGAADVQARRNAMVDAFSALTAANADMRIEVFEALSAEQRSRIQEEMPRLLRGNWADPRGGRVGQRVQRQRRGGSDPGS